MSVDLAARLVASCGAVWNMFGPTETTIWSTVSRSWPAETERRPAVPIGRPIANTRVPVLDAAAQPVPIGVPGELVHRRRGAGPRLPPPAGADRRALRRRPVRARVSACTAPATSSGGGRRRARVPRAGRPPGQGARPPHRARRDRVRAACHPVVREAVVVVDGADVHAAARRLRHRHRGRSSRRDELRAWPGERLPDYMMPVVLRPPRRVPDDAEPQDRPQRPAVGRGVDGSAKAAPRRHGRPLPQRPEHAEARDGSRSA